LNAGPQESPRVVVHVLSGCPHCWRATTLLDRRGVEYEVVSGDGVPGFRRRLRKLTGESTVPQIVIGDRPIGSADQLARLNRLGVLEALLAGSPFPLVRVRQRRWARRQARWVAEARDASGRRVAHVTAADESSARAALAVDPHRRASSSRPSRKTVEGISNF